jgi:hypothetical protein
MSSSDDDDGAPTEVDLDLPGTLKKERRPSERRLGVVVDPDLDRDLEEVPGAQDWPRVDPESGSFEAPEVEPPNTVEVKGLPFEELRPTELVAPPNIERGGRRIPVVVVGVVVVVVFALGMLVGLLIG